MLAPGRALRADGHPGRRQQQVAQLGQRRRVRQHELLGPAGHRQPRRLTGQPQAHRHPAGHGGGGDRDGLGQPLGGLVHRTVTLTTSRREGAVMGKGYDSVRGNVLYRPAHRQRRGDHVVRRLRRLPPRARSALTCRSNSTPPSPPRSRRSPGWSAAGRAPASSATPRSSRPTSARRSSCSHDGRPFLEWQSHTWLLDEAGNRVRPLATELGFWRPLRRTARSSCC